MTEELFRENSYIKVLNACITEITSDGSIVLDRTIFYPRGGGQPGDRGTITPPSGQPVPISDTLKGEDGRGILHVPMGAQTSGAALSPGDSVQLELDWDRRYRHMRLHTAMHILCSLVPHGVTGGNLTHERARLDFDAGGESLDKAAIEAQLNERIEQDHPVSIRQIKEEELDQNPELVRTLSVSPPRGTGSVRLIQIEGVDLQPCGGTHVQHTAEIGRLTVLKIESKGKRNRRIQIGFTEDST